MLRFSNVDLMYSKICLIATGYSAIGMEDRDPSTFSLKAPSSNVLGPWLYAAFISAVNEVGIDNSTEGLSEDLNCEKLVIIS